MKILIIDSTSETDQLWKLHFKHDTLIISDDEASVREALEEIDSFHCIIVNQLTFGETELSSLNEDLYPRVIIFSDDDDTLRLGRNLGIISFDKRTTSIHTLQKEIQKVSEC